jgi:hypothetical protein
MKRERNGMNGDAVRGSEEEVFRKVYARSRDGKRE